MSWGKKNPTKHLVKFITTMATFLSTNFLYFMGFVAVIKHLKEINNDGRWNNLGEDMAVPHG